MAMYMFNLHIPLGIGGLSTAAYLLHQPALDPQTEADLPISMKSKDKVYFSFSADIIAACSPNFRAAGALLLLKTTAELEYKLMNFLKFNKLRKERNWLLTSALGFGSLILLVFFTSLLVDIIVEAKAMNNPLLKEILLSDNISKTVCVLVYCLITPLLEEIVYRGFLLRSLAVSMNWQKAVFISSLVFSAAHFSSENLLQLFIIWICSWMLLLLDWKLEFFYSNAFIVQCFNADNYFYILNIKLKPFHYLSFFLSLLRVVSNQLSFCNNGRTVPPQQCPLPIIIFQGPSFPFVYSTY